MSRIRVVARVGAFRSPRSPFVVISAAAHFVLLLLIVFFPTLGSGKRTPQDFIVVTLTPGPPPVQSVRSAPEAAPEPAERTPPEGVRVEEKIPEPKPPEKKKKVQEPKPEPKKTPPPQEVPVQRPAVEPPPDENPPPGEATGGGGIDAEVSFPDLDDIEFAWYRDRLSAALKSHWRRPILERQYESLSVVVTLEIQRDGSVRNPQIETGSGVPSLDRSALRAVRDADPLPPLPPNWRRPSMSARFVFRWYPER